ncbi:hypothetical protein BC834DRAFT_436594 [Gloeopeniophorella convolvens]|nr:hypothetical protein BC834DRAFT_436594 [Gloeopeniophorella convolvens]
MAACAGEPSLLGFAVLTWPRSSEHGGGPAQCSKARGTSCAWSRSGGGGEADAGPGVASSVREVGPRSLEHGSGSAQCAMACGVLAWAARVIAWQWGWRVEHEDGGTVLAREDGAALVRARRGSGEARVSTPRRGHVAARRSSRRRRSRVALLRHEATRGGSQCQRRDGSGSGYAGGCTIAVSVGGTVRQKRRRRRLAGRILLHHIAAALHSGTCCTDAMALLWCDTGWCDASCVRASSCEVLT